MTAALFRFHKKAPLHFSLQLQRKLVVLHLDKLHVLVIELILEETEFLRWHDIHAEAISHLPAHLQAPQSLGYVGIDIRVYIHMNPLHASLVHQLVYHPLYLLNEKY